MEKANKNSFTLLGKIILAMIIVYVIVVVIIKFIDSKEPKCSSEYDYDEDLNMCVKVLETNAVYNTEYYCVIGTLINNMCYIANSAQVIQAHANYYSYFNITTYSCDYGYNLVGNMCYPISTEPATRTTTICPRGYTKNKSGIGIIEVPQIEVPGVLPKCYKRVTTSPK